MTKTSFIQLLKRTVSGWWSRDPFKNSAVIAYYTIFSLPGLLMIVIAMAGYFYGISNVTQEISRQFESMIGKDVATYITTLIENSSKQEGTFWASVVGIASLMFGATGAFYQMQQTLNGVWEVEPKKNNVALKLIKDRLFSFGLVLTVGFLLIVSLILSTIITATKDWFAGHYSEVLISFFNFLDIMVSIGVIGLLFSAIFRFLPDAEIPWRNVITGGMLTAVFFVVAKSGLAYYFSHSTPASTYGAAGSIILVMLWVTYSSMILLFGAEFTKEYTLSKRETIVPSDFAKKTVNINS